MMHSWTVIFRQSAVSKSLALSKAIRDGDYSVMAEIVQERQVEEAVTATTQHSSDDSPVGEIHLLLQANSRGWTPLHVAASTRMPYSWWRWILMQAAAPYVKCLDQNTCPHHKGPAGPLWTAETEMGQTCIDLFFQANLYPALWKRGELRMKAIQTRRAINHVCVSPQLTQDLSESLEQWMVQEHRNRGEFGVPELSVLDDDDDEEESEQHADQSAVHIVLCFWKRLHLLLHVAYDGHDPYKDSFNATPILQILSSLHWCPHIVGRLAVALCPNQVRQCNTKECPLPLHRWSQTRTQHCFDQERIAPPSDIGIVGVLCKAYPQAVSLPDPANHNRLALHSSLANGKLWQGNVQLILNSFPDAILELDPCTGLPCFCLAALPRQSEEKEEVAKQLCLRNRALSWSYLSNREKSETLEKAQRLLECHQLTTIYQLLRHHPPAINNTAMTARD